MRRGAAVHNQVHQELQLDIPHELELLETYAATIAPWQESLQSFLSEKSTHMREWAADLSESAKACIEQEAEALRGLAAKISEAEESLTSEIRGAADRLHKLGDERVAQAREEYLTLSKSLQDVIRRASESPEQTELVIQEFSGVAEDRYTALAQQFDALYQANALDEGSQLETSVKKALETTAECLSGAQQYIADETSADAPSKLDPYAGVDEISLRLPLFEKKEAEQQVQKLLQEAAELLASWLGVPISSLASPSAASAAGSSPQPGQQQAKQPQPGAGPGAGGGALSVSGLGTEQDPLRIVMAEGLSGPEREKAMDYVIDQIEAGKFVEFTQPQEVSIMMDRMNTLVQDAIDNKEDEKVYNLCQVTLAGANIFCHDNKGIPRVHMPQLSGQIVPGSPLEEMIKSPEDYPGLKIKRNKDGSFKEADIKDMFVERLFEGQIAIESTRVLASELRASQSELKGGKVSGMASSMLAGTFPEDVLQSAIIVSSDNYVIDGHHRWAARVGVDLADGSLGDIDIPVLRVDIPVLELLDRTNRFADEMGIAAKSAAESTPKQPSREDKPRVRKGEPIPPVGVSISG